MIIQTPRARKFKASNGTVTVKFSDRFALQRSKNFIEVQKFIDSETLRKCDPYVPMDTGTLKRSGTLGTVIGSGLVVYNAPYARRQYYTNSGNGRHNSSHLRGSYWFERMKADHLDEILAGAKKVAGVK